ncbi:hypothetical protein F0562_025335, partial [Nyssa sinensis]
MKVWRLRLTRKPGLREALTCACPVWTMRLRRKSGRAELAFGAVSLTVEIGKVAVGHEALGYCVGLKKSKRDERKKRQAMKVWRLRLTRKPGLREALTCACPVWTMRLRRKSGRAELAFGAVSLTVEIGKVAVGHEALG